MKTTYLLSKYLANKYNTNIYVIGGVNGGGSLKFINEMIMFYPNITRIKMREIIESIVFTSNDILLIQHLADDITPKIIIEIKEKYKCKIFINIHDFYYLTDFNSSSNSYLFNNIIIKPEIKKLFNDADKIIHPSKFTYDIYSKYFLNNNFVIIQHNDYYVMESPLNIPLIKDKIINIGVMHQFNKFKGAEIIYYLNRKFKDYNGYKIEFKINGINIPYYKENEFYNKLTEYNIHCLTSLNVWGETYCYALSKFLKSGLPIIYNNIGSFKERIPNKDHYFKVFDNENYINIRNSKILDDKFIQMIDYIIKNQNNLPKNKIDLNLCISPMYTNILINNNKNQHNVKAYCIYFPQFHTIHENDINFYKDYTDITNLNLLIKELKIQQETPSNKLLPIENILDYDLVKNTKLIQRQIDLMNEYNISGIAMYYYWFSKNTITNNHMIMEKVIDQFFSPEIKLNNLKVFFIWANESWSKNVAFGNVDEKIENEYDEINLCKNIENMLIYFKHSNYLKIDNKPVFFIHHPWFIPLSQLNLFKLLINKKCIENNFDGCHLLINSMNGMIENFKHYDHHMNYKNFKHYKKINNQNYIDYQSYINELPTTNNVKTLVFGFDNRARLYKPARLYCSTQLLNNTEDLHNKFISKIYNSYSRTTEEIDKIMLINSWNEWGEQMAIEPSNEKGTYYLDLLQNIL